MYQFNKQNYVIETQCHKIYQTVFEAVGFLVPRGTWHTHTIKKFDDSYIDERER